MMRVLFLLLHWQNKLLFLILLSIHLSDARLRLDIDDQHARDQTSLPVFKEYVKQAEYAALTPLNSFMMFSDSEKKNTTLLFWHIPKAGGSTVEYVFQTMHAPFVRSPTTYAGRFDLSNFIRFKQEVKNKNITRIVSDYLPSLLRAPDQDNPKLLFTVFRDPVSQAKSFFLYRMYPVEHEIRKDTHGAKSVRDWLATPYGVPNFVCSQITGVDGRKIREKHLRQAMQLVQSKMFVLLLSDLHNGMKMLTNMLGWEGSYNGETGSVVKNKAGTKFNFTVEDAQLIEKANWCDVRLYEFAEQRYEGVKIKMKFLEPE